MNHPQGQAGRMNTLYGTARINTAGAYIRLHGSWLFTIGMRTHNEHIPVVRVGGHREEGESGWQCAAREAYEETGLRITPLAAPATYAADWEHLDDDLREIAWPGEPEGAPLLVITHHIGDEAQVSLMYLAGAKGTPVPSNEVKGLILLEDAEVRRVCSAPLTLGEYMRAGGKAILSAEFDTRLELEPFAQLRILGKLLESHVFRPAQQ